MRKATKNGFVGKLANVEIPVFYYCNEKTWKKGHFFFGCVKGCIHNPYPGQKPKVKQEKLI